MIVEPKNIGVVVECYHHTRFNRVMIVRSRECKNHFFFYIPLYPPVDFGDKIQMNFEADTFYICRGNSKLTYKITPLIFPNTLLLELINERLSL